MIQISSEAKQMPIVLMSLTKDEVLKLTKQPYVLDDIYVVSSNNQGQMSINMYNSSKNSMINQWYFYDGKKILTDQMVQEYLTRSFFEVMPTVDGKIAECKVLGGTIALLDFINQSATKQTDNKSLIKK